MKIEKLGQKAREEHARSLIAFGRGLFQAMYVSLFLLPITAIFSEGARDKTEAVSIIRSLSGMDQLSFTIFLILWGGGILIGLGFWRWGLKRLDNVAVRCQKT